MKQLIAVLMLASPLAGLAASPQTAVLDVGHMTCALCPIAVRKALERVPGVIDATVDYDHKTATVKYDPEKASPATLAKAATNAGFPSQVQDGTKNGIKR